MAPGPEETSPVVDLTRYPITELETADISPALIEAVHRAQQGQSFAAHGSSPMADRGTVK